MRPAPEAENEKERLEALYQLEILDTEAEDVFDDFTRIASQICDTPIALISLVDKKRQWFKSKVGLNVSETSRNLAFCAHAIHQHDIFEISDASKDDRFSDNPLVTSAPYIRFYAGAPLISSQGHAIGTLCTISDKPKSLTQHQREALEVLSRAVIAQLELRFKNRQLAMLSQRKTDFLSTISHELRTPLNAIITLNELMLEEVSESPLPEKFVQYMKHINYSGKRLMELVNSVLDLNKAEAGKMELSPTIVESANFFSSIEGAMRAKAEKKNIDFSAVQSKNLPALLYADESKLSRIIFNLLSNAIKFTPERQWVRSTASCADEHLVLTIEDGGVGIAKHELDILFDKFTQVGGHKDVEGSGLGLAITKALVELMNGTIVVESEPGKGTIVTVSLPLMPVPEAVTPEQASPGVAEKSGGFNTRANILVVEDNLINQEVAKAVFESLELNIDLVENGEQAVLQVRQTQYDLIFMDLNLPGIDGWEAVRQIRLNNTQTPIVALSATVLDTEASILASRGVQGFVTKPIDIATLIKVLEKTIPISKNN